MSPPLPLRALLRALLRVVPLLVLSTAPAWAMYKVVGPDGRVTYTDRPPVDRPALSLKPTGATPTGATPLPFELQRVADRYPVVLYTSDKCSSCDAGRQALQSRGIPFVEKTVQTAEDIRALQRLENSERVPLLKVGSKRLLGYSASDWSSYLDAAGYPAQSALPPSYRAPSATPLASAQAPAAAASAGGADAPVSPAQATPAPVRPTPAPATGNAPAGFKF